MFKYSNLIAQSTESQTKSPVNSLTKGVIYKATVSHKNKKHTHIGSTGREFKSRY